MGQGMADTLDLALEIKGYDRAREWFASRRVHHGARGARGYMFLPVHPRGMIPPPNAVASQAKLENMMRRILDRMPAGHGMLAAHTDMRGGAVFWKSAAGAMAALARLDASVLLFATCFSGSDRFGVPLAQQTAMQLGRPTWGLMHTIDQVAHWTTAQGMTLFYPDGSSAAVTGRDFLRRSVPEGHLDGYVDGALPLPLVD